MAPKLSIPLPPAMRTRSSNANKHPGRLKGLSPEPGEMPPAPPSPSAEEKKDDKEQKASEARIETKRREAAQGGVAAVEDSLRREDVDRELVADHPPAGHYAPVPTEVLNKRQNASKDSEAVNVEDNVPDDVAAGGLDESNADGYDDDLGLIGDPNDSGEASDTYKPDDDKDGESEAEDAMDVDDDEVDELIPAVNARGRGGRGGRGRGNRGGRARGGGVRGGARGGGKASSRGGGGTKVKGRDAINAQRSTTSGSGTPTVTEGPSRKRALTASAEDPNTGKKVKPGAKSGISSTFKPLQQQRQRGNDVHRIQDSQAEDDSAFQFGGYAADKEDDSAEQKAASNEKIAVKDEDGKVDVSKFTSRVKIEPGSKTLDVAKARTITAARGGDKKWKDSHLGDATIQTIFRENLLPLAKAVLSTQKPWANLTASQVQECVNSTYGADSGIVISEESTDPFMGVLAARITNFRSEFSTASDKAVRDVIKENSEVLDSEDSIKEWVAFMRTPVEGPGGVKTAPRQWKEWVDGTKHRGFLQAPMILRVLGEVWGIILEDIPEALRPAKPPIGALLLCDQANDRALKLWETGQFVAPNVRSRTSLFSADNYGDYGTSVIDNGKRVTKIIKRATQYMPTVERWNDSVWEEIGAVAAEFLEASGRRRKRSKVVVPQCDVTSEAADSEPDFFISDSNWE